MRGKRTVPIVATCPDCGRGFETLAAKPGRCPDCQLIRKREWDRTYIAKQMQTNRDAFLEKRRLRSAKWKHENPEKARESAMRTRDKLRQDPIRMAKKAETNKKYRQSHPELVVEWRKNQANRRKSDPTKYARYLHLERLRSKARRGNIKAIMEYKSAIGKLMECPRMHIRALSLPCGKQEYCFGGKGGRCQNCPPDASVPSKKFR